MTEQNFSVFSTSPGVWGCCGIRAAAGHAGAVGGSWPLVPTLWAPGAGPQPDRGRAVCPQGGGSVLLFSLESGFAVRES